MSFSTKKQPPYEHLRVFGCLCYVVVPLHQRNKFSPGAIPTVFLRYPLGYKGYKLYDIVNKKFIISRDVVFVEHKFPFTSASEPTTIEDTFEHIVLPKPLETLTVETHTIDP